MYESMFEANCLYLSLSVSDAFSFTHAHTLGMIFGFIVVVVDFVVGVLAKHTSFKFHKNHKHIHTPTQHKK